MKRYWYFASTLPSFPFGAPPPMSLDEFDLLCERFVLAGDRAFLKAVDVVRQGDIVIGMEQSPLLAAYFEWERGVRNVLVQMRARELKWSAEDFLREGYSPQSAVQAAQAVSAAPDPLQAELTLERERWNAIELLSALSSFDLDYLIAYKLKLLIAARCASFDREKGKQGFSTYYQDILHTAAEAAGSANDSGVSS